MGLIENMGKKGRAGVKLPVPTTAGDDQVIAAKTGEYVLPPEVVAAIGVEKLNALVQSITGQAPGGEPAEMPEGAMHEMMEGEAEGYAKGGCVKGMKGYARGGQVSKFDGVSLDPFADRSLSKYAFDSQGSALDDSVSRQVSRAAGGMMQSDEVFDAARPEIEDRMNRKPNGLISQLMGYAEGGIVEDDYTRRKLSGYNPQSTIRKPEPFSPRANELRGYNPQSTIPPNATTNASPRAPELRTFTPEAGRLSPQPEGTYARPSGIAAEAPRGTPSRTIAELDARAASGPRMEAARRGVQQVQASRAINPAKGTIRGLAGAAIAPTIEVADQFVTGADADVRNQFYNDPNVGTLEKAKQFGRDAAGVVLPSAGAVVGGGVGSVFAPVAGTAVGGIAGYGAGKAADAGLQAALGESALDRYKAGQPQQVAQAPQMTDKERADEIARRRAALAPQPSFEQKIGKFIADERATPAPTAAAPAPARGPVSGLAARAAKQSPAAPAAPAIDPAVMADAQAAQSQLDQSPIARVVGGTGGAMTIQYKDGTTKQVGQEGMDEVNGFYALTSRAAKQYDAQPVEIIAGNAGRAQAMPELGYQQVPDAIARSGKTGDYVTGLAQGALDRTDPVTAIMRADAAKADTEMKKQIGVFNATGDHEGRRLSNETKRLELTNLQQALNGTPEQRAAAIERLNLLRSGGKGQDEYAATSREVPLDPTSQYSPMVKEPVIYNKRTGETKQGGPQGKRSPYPDGQELLGPNGKMYVVKNGVPVPKGE